MSDTELLRELQIMQHAENASGGDSKKRSVALEAIAGPADGGQTDRLVQLAIAMIVARSRN